jgi:adenylate cyclase
MDAPSSVFTWLSDREAGISAVVGIAVLAGIVLAGVRSLVRRRAETSQEKAPAVSPEPAPADSSPPGLESLTVPGFEGCPAIAVLPFDNLSGDPEQEYFADGIAEDLITRLSCDQFFPVIARNSSFTYRGKAVDVKQVSRELGVRYVVEGSVRKVGDRVRISAQLIDGTSGAHVWADRYDRDLRDIFAAQDEITEAIGGSIFPQLVRSEEVRAAHKVTQDLDAGDSYWRAWWHYRQYSKDENAKARLLLERAIELDPSFAWAFASLAFAHAEDAVNQWGESPAESLSRAEQAIRRAVALDDDHPLVQEALGGVRRLTGQLDGAIEAYERALRLSPSYAHVYYHLGVTLAMTGKPDLAVKNIEAAMRLSPKDPWSHAFFFGMSMAHAAAGRYEESVHWAQESLRFNSGFLVSRMVLAASYANLGRLDEAQATVQALLQVNPASSLTGVKAVMAGWDPAFAERALDGLRKAGLPE